jgi:amino acid transporter
LKTQEAAPTPPGRRIQVVVATSVMLSFISFWRAAAIVLNDLGSSAFYAGGIAEQAIGSSAPWFILGVMLFSYAVRAVYVESCAMFTRGGVYRVVKEAMGSTLGKISVSALMFDYILTGPISGVSAGQYIVGLIARLLTYFGHPWQPGKETVNLLSAGIAILVTLYFWRRNTRGVHESSEDALKIMYVTTVMAVLLILWSTVTIIMDPAKRRLPPAPIPSHLTFNPDAVGWLPALAPHALEPLPVEAGPREPKLGIPPDHSFLLGLIGILIAFGHSVLAMSGEESLAQVNRELEYPKHKNLMRAGTVIFIYSLLFTSLVSFFAYAIIPDSTRSNFYDNLISGIAMNLAGPAPLKLFFHAFIVIVGFLMLSGAVNTAIIGSNGVLNRVSEDGVLTDWFRAPHRRYGTTYRMINLIVVLQLVTIIGSGGNVYTLGEAYAFGVIWSFAFKALGMLVLRFKSKEPREWKVPLNLRLGELEIPIGLAIIALFIFLIAVVNLFTKQIATVSGLAFTLIFYTMFWISERINKRKKDLQRRFALDKFTLNPKETISVQSLAVRPMNILCLVRDYQTLEHVKHALNRVDTHDKDLVVMTIRKLLGPDTGYENLSEQELFTDYEQLLFSRVVSLAEKAGKHVELLVVPSSNVFQAIAITSQQLNSSEIIAGRSSVMTPDEQARYVGQAWETLPIKPSHPVVFRVIDPQGNSLEYTLGAHAPTLKPEDIQLIHRIWLEIIAQPGNENLHHRDVVTYALHRLKTELSGKEREKIIREIGSNPENPAA